MKYIIIGDPHIIPTSIEEGWKLFNFSCEKARELNIKTVIVMGDLFDTHSIIQNSVLNFYFKMFNKYKDLQFITLVGNHDISPRQREEHALVGFKTLENVIVVDQMMHFEDFDAIPYCSNEEFFELIKDKKHETLLCHHEFLGCQYENGFYSKNGIDLDAVPYDKVMSGHIHKPAVINKLKYTGAPRWIHRSDANQERGIWAWDGKDYYEFYSTENVVGKIVEININKNNDLPDLNANLYKKVILRVSGKPSFIQEMSALYAGKAELIPTVEEEQESQVSEMLGVNAALKKFILSDYQIKYSSLSNKELLENIVNELNNL